MFFVYTIIITSFILPNGILSDNYQKSINYSFGLITDNESYILESNEDGPPQYEDIKSNIYNANINMVFKGRFEISLDYLYNNNIHNSYDLPFKGEYNNISFSYYLKDMEKIPVNFIFSIEGKYRDEFNSNSYSFGLYKEFNLGDYPLIPVFKYSSSNIMYNVESISYDKSYNSYHLDFYVKLVVDTSENTPIRDILWFCPSVIFKDNDQFFSFSLGLYHPIK